MNTMLRALPLAAATLLTACAAPGGGPDAPGPAEWPAFPAPSDDAVVYRLDRTASTVIARVDPAGPMARLGHSHVVGGPVASGRIVVGSGGARADIELHAADFDVDRPEWRRAFGLDPDLDASAIEGTRANLLGPEVLDATTHPTLDLRTTAVRGPDWLPDVTLRVRWRGEVREYTIPVAVSRDENRIEIAGRIELRHSDFGFAPFSAAGGALRVSDRIGVRFRLVAVAGAADVAIIAPRSITP